MSIIVPKGVMLSNANYDRAVWLVQVFLPAVGALYFGLGQIWNFPNIEGVVGTVTVLSIFIGTLIGVSGKNYRRQGLDHQGRMVVTESENGLSYSLELDEDPEKLKDMDRVVFNVGHMPTTDSA